MKPVMQNLFVGQITGYWNFAKRSVPGNCFQACVASMLEMLLEAVPHFMTFENKWLEAFIMWMGVQGYTVEWTEEVADVPTDRFYLLTGKSPRGDFNHTVVARNGEMVHDPHHAQVGVESFLHAIWGVRIEE